MRTYKEQTELILEKVNRHNNAKKKRVRYIYSLSTAAAACLIIFLSVYTLPMILQTPINPPEIIPTEPNGEDNYDENAMGGGPDFCIHYDGRVFNESYHSIPGLFAFFIHDVDDPDAFERWSAEAHRLSKENATEQCGARYSAMDFFIQYFDIKREDFEKLYYHTYLYSAYDFNIDILYSGDKAIVEHYYSELAADNIPEMELRGEIRDLKDLLIEKTFGDTIIDGGNEVWLFNGKFNEEYQVWVKSLDKNNIIDWFEANLSGEHDGVILAGASFWSIPEFIYHWGVSEEDYINYIALRDMNTYHVKYDYAIEKIFRDNTELKQAIENVPDVNTIDRMIVSERSRGEPDDGTILIFDDFIPDVDAVPAIPVPEPAPVMIFDIEE